MESRDAAAPADGGAASVPGPGAVRRPLMAALWIVVVLAAAAWPLVSRLLGRRPG